jgi:5-methylcytosine-specific restriction endonuclease McrA
MGDKSLEARRESYRRWRERHPEHAKKAARERMRKWRAAHPERNREISRQSMKRCRERDPEKIRARKRAWYKANPAKVKRQRAASYQRNKESHARRAKAYIARVKADPKAYARLRKRLRVNLRAWRLRNREHVNASAITYQRKTRKLNPHRYRAADKRKYAKIKKDPVRYAALLERNRKTLLRWRQLHRKHYNAQASARVKAARTLDPEKFRKHCQLRRARQFAAVGSHTLSQWLSRVRLYGWRCTYCGKRLTKKTLTKDHRIPLSRGGSDYASNLVPACGRCNTSKGNRKKPVTLPQ